LIFGIGRQKNKWGAIQHLVERFELAIFIAYLAQCFYNVETYYEGHIMEAVIRKWGNSPALRLPVSALRDAELSLEQKVNIVVTRGRIVIEPSEKIEYDLDELLAGITVQNSHAEVDFGKPVGKEAF
jgi:antitoxin MazE